MNLQVGDIVIGTQAHNRDVVREITEVRTTGYTWCCPDIEGQDWISENSCDPFFELGWELVEMSKPNCYHSADTYCSKCVTALLEEQDKPTEPESLEAAFRRAAAICSAILVDCPLLADHLETVFCVVVDRVMDERGIDNDISTGGESSKTIAEASPFGVRLPIYVRNDT